MLQARQKHLLNKIEEVIAMLAQIRGEEYRTVEEIYNIKIKLQEAENEKLSLSTSKN